MKIITALCFIIFTTFLIKAQILETVKKEDSPAEITTVRSVWTYPIFANDIQFSKDEFYDLIENVAVQSKRYTFNKAKNIKFENCNSQNDKKGSQDNWQSYVVSNFLTYEANGRVFAYLFYDIIPERTLLAGEDRSGYIAYFKYLYVDENGDGTFESNCKRSAIEPLPQWVKDIGQLKVKTK